MIYILIIATLVIINFTNGITRIQNKENKNNYSNLLDGISYAELDETLNQSGKLSWPLYLTSYFNKEHFYKYSENEWKIKMVKATIELNKLSKINKINKNNLINFK